MKKTIAAILAGAMTLYSLSVPTLAAGSSSTYGLVLPGGTSVHGGEVSSGTYVNENNKNLVFLIVDSAKTNLLNSSVYNSATVWNNISNNVDVYVYYDALPSPFPLDKIIPMPVIGTQLEGNVVAQTIPHDKNGNVVSVNSNWMYVHIEMDTSPNAFSIASDPTAAAKKTFIHEVGHALKLEHPTKNATITGHSYNGYPYAVMNQNLPKSLGGASQVASCPTWHDIECLTYKWGE